MSDDTRDNHEVLEEELGLNAPDLTRELQLVVDAAHQQPFLSCKDVNYAHCPECGGTVESRVCHTGPQFTAADAAMSRHLIKCPDFIARLTKEAA